MTRKMNIKCEICRKPTKNCGFQLCRNCYSKLIYRKKKKGMSHEDAYKDLATPGPDICSKCSKPVVCRGYCKKHYQEAYRNKDITFRQYTKDGVENEDDKSMWSLTSFWKDTNQHQEVEADEKYMSDRYDVQLKKTINHYKKTGKIVDFSW